MFRTSKVTPKRSSQSLADAADGDRKRMKVRQLERTVEAVRVAAKIPCHSSILRERKATYTVHACAETAASIEAFRARPGYTSDLAYNSRHSEVPTAVQRKPHGYRGFPNEKANHGYDHLQPLTDDMQQAALSANLAALQACTVDDG